MCGYLVSGISSNDCIDVGFLKGTWRNMGNMEGGKRMKVPVP